MSVHSEIEKMEFITRNRLENFWKVSSKNKEIHFLPAEFSGNGANQFVIYLNGLSVQEQIKKTNGLINYPFESQERTFGIRKNRFWTNSEEKILKKIANEKGHPGYYLVEIIENFTDDNLPKNWRPASVNETTEILQSIFYVSGLRYLEDRMHIASEENKTVLAVGDFKPGQGLEIWRGHKEIFKKYKKQGAILVYQANEKRL